MSSWLTKAASLFSPNHEPEKPVILSRLGWAAALAIGLLVVLVSPSKLLAAAVGIVVLVGVFRKPEAALLFLATYIPFEPFLLKFVSDDIYVYARYSSELLVYAIVAAAVVRVIAKRRPFVQTPLDLPFIFFLLVAVASVVINAVPVMTGILGLRQIIRFVLLFFAVVYLNPTERFMRTLVGLMLAIVVFEGTLGAFQAMSGGSIDEFLLPNERRYFENIQLTTGTDQFWEEGARVFATMGRYDQLGTFLCFFMLLVLGWYYESSEARARHRLVAIGLIAAPALYLTLSRASWFGFALGLLFIGAWLKRDRRVRYAFLALIVSAFVYLSLSGLVVNYMTDYAGQTPVERFFEAFSYERWRGEYYGLGRLFWIVQTPLVVIRSAPLFGVGPGQFGGGAVAALGNTRIYEKLNLPYGVYGSEGYIDNNWFSLWGETGTIGIVLYLWMFAALFGIAYRTWRRATDEFTRGLALGFLGCLVAVTFQAFLATYLEVRTLALYFWLFAGLLYVSARREKIYE